MRWVPPRAVWSLHPRHSDRCERTKPLDRLDRRLHDLGYEARTADSVAASQTLRTMAGPHVTRPNDQVNGGLPQSINGCRSRRASANLVTFRLFPLESAQAAPVRPRHP